METIDQAVAFIRTYIEKEYDTEVAHYTERDDSVFKAKLTELNKMYAAGLTSEIYRPKGVPESRFKRWQKQLEQTQKRVLFQVKKYNHPDHESLYRFYLSSTQLGDDTYFTCFYLANTENGLKIVSQYNVSSDQGNGISWNWRGGLKLDKLGELVEVRQFQTPTDPEHLKEYEAE